MKMIGGILQNIQGFLGKGNLTWLGVAVLVIFAACCIIGYQRGFIREVLSTLFIFLAIGIVWLVNPYVNRFLKEVTPVYEIVQENCENYISKLDIGQAIDEQAQQLMIEEMNLPGFLTKELLENNNAVMYAKMGVTSFLDYLADSLANMITNGISFLTSYVLAYALLQILAFVLNLFSKLPIISGINKIAGAVLGGVKCLLFIWIAMMIVTIFWNSGLAELIASDRILNFLYTNNLIAKLFTGVGYGV